MPDSVLPLHLADFVYPPAHPLAGQTGTVFGFAIRAGGDVILVDTGIGFGNSWIDESYRPTRREIREALAAAGIDAASVRVIVNSHLHFDHCGQNSAFPNIPIVVQRTELEAARLEGHTVPELIDFSGATYRVVDGDAEVADGVSVLATPGHTAGHQSVTVRTGDGLVLLVGQAAQDARSFATAEADQSIKRLRELNADRIHFAHDRAVLRRR
jgi:N-acyl homoserine lactone hydrolase